MERTANCNFFLLAILLLLILPVSVAAENAMVIVTQAPDPNAPYAIQLFIPTEKMIHSDQIHDVVSRAGGETILGTSFGLSTYNGSWSTRHQNLNNISEGLMDDYITALELDHAGNLWIGYSGGLQIYDGRSFTTIRDQQILKETRIKDLQRWDRDMWVATGHAGIHRYRDGTWTWYQPMAADGPGFYEVRSMALDSADATLVIATEVEGLWTVQLPEDQATFTEIAPCTSAWGFLSQVRRDPRGGVYLHNSSMVVHYDPVQGFVPVLTGTDLAPAGIAINDITAAPDGRLFIATDDGMYIWKDGGITAHLGRFEGMGTSPALRTIAIDAKGRVWFSSQGYVGFYADRAASAPTIAIEMVTPVPVTTTLVPTTVPVTIPTLVPVIVTPTEAPFFAEDSPLKFLNPIIDPIVKAVRAMGSHG